MGYTSEIWPAREEELRAHWDWRSPEGHYLTAREIGIAMGLTKGMVIGKADRMKLPPRTERKPLKIGDALNPDQITEDFGRAPYSEPAVRKPPKHVPPAKPESSALGLHRPYQHFKSCQNVLELGRYGVGTVYCEKPSATGKPFCPDCAKRMYIKSSRVSGDRVQTAVWAHPTAMALVQPLQDDD